MARTPREHASEDLIVTPWPRRYFTSIWACFATSLHSTTSFLMKAANSSGVLATIWIACASISLAMSGSFSALTISVLSRLTIAGGVPVGRHDAVPGDRVEAGIAALGDGRQVGRDRRALLAGHPERDQGAGLDMRQRGNGIGEHQLHLSRDQIGDRERGAAIGDVRHLDPGLVGKQLGDEMVGAADAGGAVIQRARLALRQRHQLGDRLHAERRVDHEDVGIGVVMQIGTRSFSGS